MKRIVLIFAGIFALSVKAHAGMFEQGSVITSTDTRLVVVSSVSASPTKILSRDSYITRTSLTNNTSFFVMLSTASNNFSVGSTFSLPPCVTNTSCQAWSPDGPTVPYWGQMYAVIVGSSSASNGNTMSVFRSK